MKDSQQPGQVTSYTTLDLDRLEILSLLDKKCDSFCGVSRLKTNHLIPAKQKNISDESDARPKLWLRNPYLDKQGENSRETTMLSKCFG